MVLFRRQRLRPGLIFSVHGTSLLSKLITLTLTKGFNALPEAKKLVPSCPSHDGMIVEVDEMFFIAESRPLRARLTPLDTYEIELESNISYNPRIFEVKGLTTVDECKAAEYWLKYINGTWYDFMSFPRLCIKGLLIDKFNTHVGWEWANWCTEGVAKAYQEVLGRDIYNNPNPTPLTTIKRVLEGVFRDVTTDMLIS